MYTCVKINYLCMFQVNELKKKLQEIELSLPTAPEELRLEYESQIQNIRKLRQLYEERALATRTEHQQERERDTAKINMLELKVNELQEEIQEHKDKNTSLEVKITKFEETVEEKITEIESLQDQLYSSTVECRSLKSQMKIINHLFSQVLAGPEFDLDRLTRLLKENHGLITDLTATGDTNDVAALLLDIAEKAEEETQIIPGSDIKQDQTEENLQKEKEEIASNLSKVWRVLVELLSHHKDVNPNNAGGSESCYKSVDTPSGPRLVISVSQTFLTLKDLILEKNSLVKEVGRLKTLNGHLETRMHCQERRLSTVSTELKKTWSVVSKLRAQHKQLHNHEKILRYELQHKRQMLTELKQELEHCREKWDKARQKNTQSEEDWKQLRKEFALRKTRKLSNSAESGYEEEDSHSSPSEEINEPSDPIDTAITIKQDNSESSEDLSEEDVEHSDGNSYETVIDLLDIACLESQIENENLTNTEELISFIDSQEALPLNNNELTQGLSHIESVELASELDICRTNIPTPDFSSPFPSSSSSPILTETEDLTSSEIDISEEIPRSVSPFHQFHFTEEPIVLPDIPQDNFLFGSNSAQNISRFLEGLIETDILNVSEANFDEEREINEQEHLSETVQLEQPCKINPELVTVPQNYTFEVESQKESITDMNVQDEKEKNQTFTAKQQTIIQDSVPKLENDMHEELTSNETNTTFSTLPDIENTTKTLSFKYDIPKILISENELTIQSNQETPEINENLNNENSVFDSECVANAIQLCLQDIQNSIPVRINESETTEVNNNVPEIILSTSNAPSTVLETSVHFDTNENVRDSINNDKNFIIKEEISPNSLIEEDAESIIQNRIEIPPTTETVQIIEPSTSEMSTKSCDEIKKTRTPQEILEARAARLKRLEEQCKSLFTKMSATSRRSDLISNKLEELHEHYGPSQYPLKYPNSAIPLTATLTTPVFTSDDSLQHANSDSSEKSSNSEGVIQRLNNPSTSSQKENLMKDGLDSDPCCSKRLEPMPLEENPMDSSTDKNTILDARAERLKRLEDQCKSLYAQVTKTNHKSNAICNKLQELHEHYGSPDESSSSNADSTHSNDSEENQNSKESKNEEESI